MAHFILVHGMFHGGWCWDRLRQRLEAAGHVVEAPDLAGCGRDKTPPGNVSLDDWANDIAGLVAKAPSPPIVVGHSRGGLVISAAAEQAHERVAALVYLTALMLPSGTTSADLPRIMAEEGFATDQFEISPQFGEDGTTMLPPDNAQEAFYGHCSPTDVAWAWPQVGPEPLKPLLSPLWVSAERWGAIPRIYIETTQDKVLPIEAQRAMLARSGASEVITLESDHMPILNKVEELAAILDDIAVRYAATARSA